MLNYELIDSVLKDADGIPSVAGSLNNYSAEAFNYKPSGGWSAGECIDHLIKINEKYFPIFEDISRKYSMSGVKEYKTSFMGKFIIKSVNPDTPRKTKTLPPFYPSSSEFSNQIIDEFLDQHRKIRTYIERFREHDLKKIKITSPLSSIVRYNLGDACRILIYHDLRHLGQAHRAAGAYAGYKNEAG
jgi:hypothetical protein